MTMDTCEEPEVAEPSCNYHQDVELEKEFVIILNHLTAIEEICFKSQQRGEADLTREEKFKIGANAFNKNKLHFLIRFGEHLRQEHLDYFKQFASGNDEDSNSMTIILSDLCKKAEANKKSFNVKNRRYEALKEMIMADSYFSETEMMKRNPLLYEQLVGQYLTKEEIRERDRFHSENQTSFVKILMEGIERDDAELKKKDQAVFEEGALEESDSDSDENMLDDERSRSPIGTRTLWGEFENEGKRMKPKVRDLHITEEERKLLREEFITTMYQSFLDGADEDFDYNTVDCNAKYDSVETIEHDEEDKYFDAEEPADAPIFNAENQDSSEDELDIYMSALNDNPRVRQLSSEMKKVNTSG